MADPELAELRKEIDEIVQNYLNELVKLRLQHRDILNEFSAVLTQERIKQIRKLLSESKSNG